MAVDQHRPKDKIEREAVVHDGEEGKTAHDQGVGAAWLDSFPSIVGKNVRPCAAEKPVDFWTAVPPHPPQPTRRGRLENAAQAVTVRAESPSLRIPFWPLHQRDWGGAVTGPLVQFFVNSATPEGGRGTRRDTTARSVGGQRRPHTPCGPLKTVSVDADLLMLFFFRERKSVVAAHGRLRPFPRSRY